MTVTERQQKILEYLREQPNITVAKLAKLLFVSEPTVRRDFTELDSKGMLKKAYGGALLMQGATDTTIPYLFREHEKTTAKAKIGKEAASLVKDGMVVLMDASTSVFHVIPYLTGKKDLIVVTSGAKTAVALAEAGFRTYCTGGQMLIHSFSYIGAQTKRFLNDINADILFFSSRGIAADGRISDQSVEETDVRREMFLHAKKKYFLCDSSKFGKSYFYNLCSLSDIDGIISDQAFEIEELS